MMATTVRLEISRLEAALGFNTCRRLEDTLSCCSVHLISDLRVGEGLLCINGNRVGCVWPTKSKLMNVSS